MDSEVFYPIKGFESHYLINKNGEIYSSYYKRKLTPHLNKQGYYMVSLQVEKIKRTKNFRLHRLLAINFLKTDDYSLDIAHLDGNPKNNKLTNLKWCTRKENMSHCVDHGTRSNGSRCGKSKLKEDDVIKIRTLYKKGEYNQKELAKMFKVTHGNISAIILRKSWHHLSENLEGRGEG